jgi:hypothetical protein
MTRTTEENLDTNHAAASYNTQVFNMLWKSFVFWDVSQPAFRKKISPQSSGSKCKPSKEPARSKQALLAAYITEARTPLDDRVV